MTKKKSSKPILIQCGRNYIDPNDVVAICRVKKDLYVVRLRSNPNPEYPIWIEEKNISNLMSCFNITEEKEDET